MCKVFLLAALCTIATVFNCMAQADYQPGYIVDLKGDTIRGLIDYKRWDRNPRKIEFKNSAASSASEFYPIQLKSFSVADEIYEGAIVEVEESPYKLNALDTSPTPIYARDTVFLQSLIRGEKSLLFLKDQIAKRQFYTKENNSYKHLLYKQYTSKTKESSKVVRENNEYKGVLALYLKDCPSMQEKLRRTTYTLASLTKVFEYYYECTGTTLTHAKERQEGMFEAGIVAGASITQINLKGPFAYLSKMEYGSSINPSLGIFYDLKFVRTKGWRLANELLFTSFDVKGDGFFEDFPDYSASSSFSYSYLKTYHALHVGLLAQGKFYAAAGLTAGVVIDEDVEVKLMYETGTTSYRNFQSKKFEFGYLAGLGFRGGSWNAEFRFEQTNGIANSLSVGSTTLRGYFLIRYRILAP